MLPYFAKGQVIKGFGRGSRDLGCPTANLSRDAVEALPEDFKTGVYFGYASVDSGKVYKMVMSLGWNPFYNNETKTMEIHILHEFESDFYDKELRVAVLGYMRQEKKFGSVNELIDAIKDDILQAKNELNASEFVIYRNHSFFIK
ncbi:riboflavin kinase-like [Diorhabda carinulata]|uniref:riboflavin kinase-like n=1 Tax=Diorhabda sublineata TaxID=1163346 RepID=UPI0024E0DB38|nr:riboflavin kinase-like [Diorhabda sublineata]XP_057657833.1 riboflavin kinase-like [Diorhabda carinulata]